MIDQSFRLDFDSQALKHPVGVALISQIEKALIGGETRADSL